MRRARPLLGTFVDIAVDGGAAADMAAAVDAAFAAVERVHGLMSFHDPASDLGRLNREAVLRPVAVDPWTHEVVATAIDLHRASDGLFDITVAPTLQRLRLLPGGDLDPLAQPAPPGPTARYAIEMLPDHRIRFRHPGTRIDLGGIAKGFAVDRAVAVLRAHGVPRGVVNAGGDLAAFGPLTEQVDIRDPCNPRRTIARTEIMNEAIASSGARFDPIGAPDVMASAVIDPRAGEPVRAIAGATVRAPSCMIADALTKVVMSAGEGATALLDQFSAGALLVRADGTVRVSPSWQAARAA